MVSCVHRYHVEQLTNFSISYSLKSGFSSCKNRVKGRAMVQDSPVACSVLIEETKKNYFYICHAWSLAIAYLEECPR
jgi:hypothetical protein